MGRMVYSAKNRGHSMIEKWIAFFVVTSFLGWVAWKSFQNSDDSLSWFITKSILSVVMLFMIPLSYAPLGVMSVPFTLFICIILTWFWAPTIASFIANPLSSIYGFGDADNAPTPLYSVAQARVKQGKYEGAIVEIRKQLSHFPDRKSVV